MKAIKILMLSLVLCIGMITWLLDQTTSDAEVGTICAYGQIVIRIKEGNNIWGTTMLDESGAPIRCSRENMETYKSVNKGNII